MDLGLPSGLLWADRNVGARSFNDVGYYFSWGNTNGQAMGGEYDFSNGTYSETPGAQIRNNLDMSQDAARVYQGDPWRMPSSSEFQELNANCTHVWTSINGMQGILFTSNINGATLFMPAAGSWQGRSVIRMNQVGSYWSTSYYDLSNARYLSFNQNTINPNAANSRFLGFTIRAVCLPTT